MTNLATNDPGQIRLDAEAGVGAYPYAGPSLDYRPRKLRGLRGRRFRLPASTPEARITRPT